MKTFLALVIYFTLAAAIPAKPSNHADVYKNTLTRKSSRISGGSNAVRYQIPYQASIRHAGTLGLMSHICGGTLIHESWVVTAGHCRAYDDDDYEVALGLLLQYTVIISPDVQTIDVDQFIVHPNYPGGVATNDIALIKLKTPATVTKAVKLAPLPQPEECDIISDTILSGWGLTSPLPVTPVNLKWAKLPRITNQQCAADLTTILGTSRPLDDSMICTSSNQGQTQSACSGDSGGPLVLASNKHLVGVVSWGINPCGTAGAPSVYTKVCSHVDFINMYVPN